MKKFLTLAFVAIALSSCMKTAIALRGNMMSKTYKIQRLTNGDKTIAYLGVMHVNTPEYFQRIRKDIDSMRAVGYSIMYEGILTTDAPNTKEHQDTLDRKLRQILGIHITAYADSANQDMSKYHVKGFVNQTPENTGIDRKIDYHADLSLEKLIAIYEERKGPIVLTQCDFDTKLGDKYKCSKRNKDNYDYLLLTLRNEHLANSVLTHTNNKIAVLYGDQHKYGLLHNLKQHDAKWKVLPIQ